MKMNNNSFRYKITQLLLMLCVAMLSTSCRETFEQLFSDGIAEGDEVTFSSSVRSAAVTRSVDDIPQKIKEYYTFKISMLQENDDKAVGEGMYHTTSDAIGSLEAEDEKSLYWPSTAIKYGFTATAGTDEIASDQSTQDELIKQDRLEGRAEAGTETYLTAKKWKAYNIEKGLDSEENYKKVPLFMQHKRALITVILKAGEGVSRKSLYYSAAKKDIEAKIYSYKARSTVALPIKPYARGVEIDYDENTKDSTTCYEAIVSPHNYFEGRASELITTISLSGQKYSFKGENDGNCSEENYNLTEGKHLTLTITLGRNSRQTLMTAYIEDWTEEVTNTICDDHGNSGAPIEIYNRKELYDFLTSETANKKGNLALVKADIDLENWYDDLNLDCTLSLGGHTLISNYRFLKNMSAAASLLNGTIQIGGTVAEAIAETNHGTINDVKITTANNNACATVAGAVKTNHGNISKCYSNLRVSGADGEDYVGGIAATSLSTETEPAIIDGCTVTNRVSGGKAGGGIVGNADGQVVNNTFEYGITLGQNHVTHKNIAGVYTGSAFANNAWPTVDEKSLGNATPESQRYTGIIDDASEFKKTEPDMRYRLAQDIVVTENTGTLGNVTYELDGNGKQITTEVMIFNEITNKVHDLKVLVSKDLIAKPQGQAMDCIAALASEVHGAKAEISNIKVKTADSVRIQAANPAGVVVWAWGDATVKNCEVLADIQAWVAYPTTGEIRKYAGGVVSTASKATITQCAFYSKGSIKQNCHSVYNNLTSAENLDASTIIYFGGIVGGIEKKANSGEEAQLTITDCSSFIVFSDMKDNYRGAILGFAENDGAQTTIDCQGNWWDKNSKAVGTCTRGVEATIGKRNSQTPTDKTDL